MTDLTEPDDGGYVAVMLADLTVQIYHRRDGLAEKYDVGDARWGCSTGAIRPAVSWKELTEMGSIAFVGEFVDRRAA